MVSFSCSCSDSCTELSQYLVLPLPPEDEDGTHEEFRTSLFEALSLEICYIDSTSGVAHCQPGSFSQGTKQCRLLRVCSCLCDCCVRVCCGTWLDALRVNDASDSELYFFQGHLQMTPKEPLNKADGGANTGTRKKAVACFGLAKGREQGTREEAWGRLAGCAGPFSFRHCLGLMQQPPEVVLLDGNGQREEDRGKQEQAAAAYAAQARRLFSLFCAPANIVRRSTPDERQTALLRASASELGAYVHPSVKVASFEGEGRGLLAAENLQQGDLLLRMPASALLNVYTALAHPTFSPLAQVLLGLPPEHLQAVDGMRASQQEQQLQQGEAQELQPLVDCDVVVCIFLLFLAFANGQEGGKALLRFLPPADAADAAATAEALRASPAAARTAAAAAEKEVLLLSAPEGVVEFLGDGALADAVSRTVTKCNMMQHQLLPMLQQAFPPPPGSQQAGVLAACRAAASAAEKVTIDPIRLPAGAVAVAAEVAAAFRDPVGPRLEGTDLLCAFVGQLNYSDFLWAHMMLDSRSFSLASRPHPPVMELPGFGSPPVQDRPKPSEETTEFTEGDAPDALSVPFLPDLCEVSPVRRAAAVALPVGTAGETAPHFHVRIPRRCASFVPLGDLLNHHFHGQVLAPSLEEEGRWLCMRMACDVPAGAQVYAHYGPLQSWQFLAYFGFCPSSFPHLRPPERYMQQAQQTRSEETKTGSEWLFSGETRGMRISSSGGRTPPLHTLRSRKAAQIARRTLSPLKL